MSNKKIDLHSQLRRFSKSGRRIFSMESCGHMLARCRKFKTTLGNMWKRAITKTKWDKSQHLKKTKSQNVKDYNVATSDSKDLF